jgi:hypothetical protein
MKRKAIVSALLVLVLALAACGNADHASSRIASGTTDAAKDAKNVPSSSFLAGQVQKGIDQAKSELATHDIDVNNVHVHMGEGHDDDSNLPKAVITPQGDLMIDGKMVPATPEQHAMLLDYRRQIIGIAEAGMDIGAHGASLGIQAAKEAIWATLTGKSGKDIETQIKPQAEQIKSAALKLCARMPDLRTSQQKLAVAIPAFAPYATMTQKDIDDCGKDIRNKK